MKYLKLVGPETYVGPRSNNELIEKGKIIEVKDEDADAMLAECHLDASNNEHPMFEEVDGPDEKVKAPAKAARVPPKAARRTRAAARA